MILSLGRHKGEEIKDLPSKSIMQLRDELTEKQFSFATMLAACNDELRHRTKHNCHFEDY